MAEYIGKPIAKDGEQATTYYVNNYLSPEEMRQILSKLDYSVPSEAPATIILYDALKGILISKVPAEEFLISTEDGFVYIISDLSLSNFYYSSDKVDDLGILNPGWQVNSIELNIKNDISKSLEGHPSKDLALNSFNSNYNFYNLFLSNGEPFKEKILTLDGIFTDIADSIRSKTGKAVKIAPEQMPTEITALNVNNDICYDLRSFPLKITGKISPEQTADTFTLRLENFNPSKYIDLGNSSAFFDISFFNLDFAGTIPSLFFNLSFTFGLGAEGAPGGFGYLTIYGLPVDAGQEITEIFCATGLTIEALPENNFCDIKFGNVLLQLFKNNNLTVDFTSFLEHPNFKVTMGSMLLGTKN